MKLEPDVIITEVDMEIERETKTDVQTRIVDHETMEERKKRLSDLIIKAWDMAKDPNNNITRVSIQCGLVFGENEEDISTDDDYDDYDE